MGENTNRKPDSQFSIPIKIEISIWKNKSSFRVQFSIPEDKADIQIIEHKKEKIQDWASDVE